MREDIDLADHLPLFPELSKEEVAAARERKSYRKMGFNYLSTTTQVVTLIAHITQESPALAKIPTQHLYVIRGILSRIMRLSRAILRMGENNQEEESINILSRSITESTIHLMWLIYKDQENRFNLFVDAGLQKELKLKAEIDQNIGLRGGTILAIEARMLRSMEKLLTASGRTFMTINPKARLPNLKEMMTDIDEADMYFYIQEMPSTSVHGNWNILYMHYLQWEEGELIPKQKESPPRDICYLFPTLFTLQGLMRLMSYFLSDISLVETFHNYLGDAYNTTLWMIKDSSSDSFIQTKQNNITTP